jgi:hypothetical protein
MQVNYKIYFCFTLRVIFLDKWFCFPLWPRQIFFSTRGSNQFELVLFSTTVLSILFYTMAIFPPCFTLGGFPPCFTLGGYGSAVPVRVPFGAVHGMATLKPRKAKEGIFRPVAKRYFYFGILTWIEIWRA